MDALADAGSDVFATADGAYDVPPRERLEALLLERLHGEPAASGARLAVATLAERLHELGRDEEARHLTASDLVESLAAEADDPDARSLVLGAGPQGAPTAVLVIEPHERDAVLVRILVVRDQGHGIGCRLLRAAGGYARAWHRPRLLLDTISGDEVGALFATSRGMERAGEVEPEAGLPRRDRWQLALGR